MADVVKNPHDKIFKQMLANKAVAQDFLRQHLPKAVLAQINLESISPAKTDFITENDKDRHADLLFKVEWHDQPGYIYLHAEQQGKPQKLMPLRMLQYLLLICQDHVRHYPRDPLPIVHMMVFYTGRQPYNYSADFFDLFGTNQALAKQMILSPFQLIDLQRISDDTLRQSSTAAALQIMMKHIKDNDLLSTLPFYGLELAFLAEHVGQDALLKLMAYVIRNANISNKQVFEQSIYESLGQEVGDEVMTFAQQLQEEGIQIGEARGRQRGIEIGEKRGVKIGEKRGVKIGEERGVKIGERRGEQKMAIRIAISMMREGMPIASVASMTGLSAKKIEEIQVELALDGDTVS